jgi:uncharacterized protein (TIGR03643 family)
MGKSRKLKNLFDSFNSEEKKKIIRMTWDDRTSYQDIEKKFELTPSLIEKFMKHELNEKEFLRWKKRLSKRFTHKGKRSKEIGAR